ncbi:Uncharacterised protein [Mycobacteroides abscessus subsp. abscessus]|uniref:hypothetical protein n=1 Tax=Mycobacteroides abscessus TaxID=36809 RepID=UPI00092A3713|nr:hypothetical protein [Mycobacteroides abscessus]SIC63664.1 Uncharacterised protein [Mycobacteroides abscessus subsp. abscessus]SIC95622.1 Uncharacterised protein [Mycobacteroides abscessus subsp. abscessus]SID20648.1 Uncharacterised protein [Mycobacteroides abscessus subsp. abscessus]SID50011.1 Uncharacterised protein [Mycobacteroides abscessus subsp. abscessus]SKU26352.1 Uncharacterised protein [Mycobacteroides abscessus subsp. abscessus]
MPAVPTLNDPSLWTYLRDATANADDLPDSTPAMTKAQFRALREALGIEPEHVAALLEVDSRNVYRWAKGGNRIPNGVRDELWALHRATEAVIDQTVASYLNSAAPPDQLPPLFTYGDEEYHRLQPDHAPLPARFHRICAWRVSSQVAGLAVVYPD